LNHLAEFFHAPIVVCNVDAFVCSFKAHTGTKMI